MKKNFASYIYGKLGQSGVSNILLHLLYNILHSHRDNIIPNISIFVSNLEGDIVLRVCNLQVKINKRDEEMNADFLNGKGKREEKIIL